MRNSSKSRKRADGRLNDARVRKLCRLLGFGLLAVSARGRVDILAEPGPYRPRGNPRRRSRLLREHERRQGDPAVGGGTRQPIMTAYRQQALTVAQAILEATQVKPRELKAMAPDAPKILLHNVYGWFARVERGVYGLTEAGREAVKRWAVTDMSGRSKDWRIDLAKRLEGVRLQFLQYQPPSIGLGSRSLRGVHRQIRRDRGTRRIAPRATPLATTTGTPRDMSGSAKTASRNSRTKCAGR